ncbi:hypothetical protein Y032_0087g2052 [Ancylostoma ceylanicum]|uniref:Uncharacterized protein n=1 Tax=Ancylostoma ceylanicum TaxID=53326 RepID=A0A016TP41_9BILA|nr:hypothetical protein Y032_0087g2052 [Ancylostoma ceylanicum]
MGRHENLTKCVSLQALLITSSHELSAFALYLAFHHVWIRSRMNFGRRQQGRQHPSRTWIVPISINIVPGRTMSVNVVENLHDWCATLTAGTPSTKGLDLGRLQVVNPIHCTPPLCNAYLKLV